MAAQPTDRNLAGPRVVSLRLIQRDESKTTTVRNDEYLSFRFSASWDGVELTSAWIPENLDSRDQLSTALAKIREGKMTPADVRNVGSLLKQLLRADPGDDLTAVLPDLSTFDEIELAREGGDERLLTDLPWEMVPMAQLTSKVPTAKLLEQTLGARSLARLLGGKLVEYVPRGRLRALLCVANPQLSGNESLPPSSAQLQPVDVVGFAKVLESVFRLFPMIVTVRKAVSNDDITLDILKSQIGTQQPHILLLVAHGHSGSIPGDAPKINLGGQWVSVSEVAAEVAKTKLTSVVLLVCCDLARTPNGPAAQPAASRFLQTGVREVLAMQGNFAQEIAKPFLNAFLSELLVSYSVSRAAAMGRIKVRSDLHAFLPAVFRNAAYASAPTVVAQCMKQYESDMADLSRFCQESAVDLPRPDSENSVSGLLDGHGVAALIGPRYSGRSHVLKRVIRERLGRANSPRPRPIFYRDCGAPALAEAGPIEVLKALAPIMDDHAGVLPEGAPANFQGASLKRAYQTVDNWSIVLVLDNLILDGDGPGAADWMSFLQSAATMSTSLLLIIMDEGRLLPAQAKTARMQYFNQQETRDYVDSFLKRSELSAERVYEYSAGVPAILDALRRRSELAGRIELPDHGLLAKEHVESIMARTVVAGLDTAAYPAVCRLLHLSGPTTSALACSFLLGNGRETVEKLRKLGIVHRPDQSGVEMIGVPDILARALRTELGNDVRAESPGVVATFMNAIDDEQLAEIFAQPGGPALLLAVQEAILQTGNREQLPVVWGIADLVDAGRVSKDLLAVIRNAIRATAGTEESTRYVVRAAQVAQAIGAQAEAEKFLVEAEKLFKNAPKPPEPYRRASYLHAHAAYLKDTGQIAKIDAILADQSEGIGLAALALNSTDIDADNRKDWSNLLVDLLESRISTSLFLQNLGTRAVEPDLTRIMQLAPGQPEYANALCTVVESQRKKKALDQQDREQIAARLAEAYHLLKGTGQDRYFGYCCYQYGRYLSLGPDPSWDEAVKMFRQAEDAARRAGEPRRFALAAYRRIKILWRHKKDDAGAPAIDGAEACIQIDRLIASLQPERADSLTLRCLQRLFTLRAQIGQAIGRGPIDAYLKEACHVGDLLPEASWRDNVRLATACERYLVCKLDQGESVEARDFLYDFKDRLARLLKVKQITLDDPRAVQKQLAEFALGQPET